MDLFLSSQILDRLWISPKSFELVIDLPKGFLFSPGQFIRIKMGEERRDYSLISAPSDKNAHLLIRKVEGGSFSSKLANLKTGAKIDVSGPFGYFTYRPSHQQAVCVATGTGIAPFISFVRSGLKIPYLIHGISEPSEMYFKDEMSKNGTSYIPCISGASGNNQLNEKLFLGRVTDYVQMHIEKKIFDFYLSGRSDMIREMMFLIDDHFPGSRIFSESFF